jgi:hypothetical protein
MFGWQSPLSDAQTSENAGAKRVISAWRSKRATHDQTVAEIARRYRQFVDLFERKDASLPSDASACVRSERRSPMES